MIEPEVTVEIENYLSALSVPYVICGDGVLPIYDEKYGINRYKLLLCTCYYNVDDEWRMIDGSAAQKVYDKLFEQRGNRPNFIQDVETVADEIILDGEVYGIFLFECRPFGFITKDGRFDYDFDVNNIIW